MAEQHRVSYMPTARDAWANNVTRLTGDAVSLDEIELLLIALQRAGHIDNVEALRLQVTYLRETKKSDLNDAPLPT